MKTGKIKLTTIEDLENYDCDRQFTYNKEASFVCDAIGRQYSARNDAEFIGLLLHFSGRRDEWGPVYDLCCQYIDQNSHKKY